LITDAASHGYDGTTSQDIDIKTSRRNTNRMSVMKAIVPVESMFLLFGLCSATTSAAKSASIHFTFEPGAIKITKKILQPRN
jgi:hypothetical protein